MRSLFIKVSLLALLSMIFFSGQELLGKHFFVSLRGENHNTWMNGLWTLPLVAILFLVIVEIYKEEKDKIQRLLPIMYIGYFLFLIPNKLYGFLFVVGYGLLFGLQKIIKNHEKLKFSFMLFCFFLMYIPLFFYPLATAPSKSLIILIEVYKASTLIRFVGWVIDRNIYKRQSYSSFWEFLEYLFCPIFFVFPGQIGFLMFDYFHKKKEPLFDTQILLKTFLLGIWSLLLISAFSYGNYLFWQNVHLFSPHINSLKQVGIHLAIGFYWLVLIYFLQAGGMSFQVCIARFLGYQLEYDMNYPLLARSPLDYFMRHSYYVRDYIVKMGLQPLALPLLRKSWSPAIVYPFVAIFSYAFFIIPQTGYRSDFERPWLVTLSLIAILSAYILFAVVLAFLNKSKKDHVFSPHILSLNMGTKAFREWNWQDYLAWLMTLLVLSASKSLLGLAKYYSE